MRTIQITWDETRNSNWMDALENKDHTCVIRFVDTDTGDGHLVDRHSKKENFPWSKAIGKFVKGIGGNNE